MISTRHDKHYHTRVKTTSSNRPAQTEDGKVVISAYVKPALANVPVYFELIDPDDRSPYDGKKKPKEQGNKDPNDNRDPTKSMKGGRLKDYTAFQDACLPARSARTRLKKIDGIQRAVAEITLNITDRHAGDNYRVRASCRDPQGKPFDSHSGTTNDGAKTVDTIPRSAVLIAWKRVYIEQDEMYQKGATILRVTRKRHNGKLSLELLLDNTDDFGVFLKKGSLITIFTVDGKTVDKKVSAVMGRTITVVAIKKNDKRIRIPKYSGVRLSRDNRTYKVSTHLFPKAFGRRSDGADGGTFVEFVWKHTGSSSIPKYTSFPNNDVEIEFCNHWYKNKGDKTNIFQLVASHRDPGMLT